MSEETVLPVVDAANHKDHDIEGDTTEDDPTIGSMDGGEDGPSQGKEAKKKKSKGKRKKKSKPSIDQTATDQGKEEESEPDKATDLDEAAKRKKEGDVRYAKALLYNPKTGEFDDVTNTINKIVGKVLFDRADGKLDPKYQKFIDCKWAYKLIEGFVRPQKASPSQLLALCTILVEPENFAALTPLVAELKWNRLILQHPGNPMFTKILLCTAHLRPTDTAQHPSDAPLIPLFTYAPLPPGPAPATPTIITEPEPATAMPAIITETSPDSTTPTIETETNPVPATPVVATEMNSAPAAPAVTTETSPAPVTPAVTTEIGPAPAASAVTTETSPAPAATTETSKGPGKEGTTREYRREMYELGRMLEMCEEKWETLMVELRGEWTRPARDLYNDINVLNKTREDIQKMTVLKWLEGKTVEQLEDEVKVAPVGDDGQPIIILPTTR